MLLAFDGNNILNRGFHAVPHLSSPKGIPTNAVKGAMEIMLAQYRRSKPTHVACVFDHPSPNFRHELYADYKGQRVRDADKERLLNPQKPLLRELLKACGLRVIRKRNKEADDVIGSLAIYFDGPALIVSNDKDFTQLLTDKSVSLIRVTGSGEHKQTHTITHKNCEEIMGLPAKKIIEMLMLMGDKVDGIPGVKGVGDGRAIQMLKTQRLSDIDPQALTPAAQRNFLEAAPRFPLTRKLITIDQSVMSGYDFNKLVPREPDEPRIASICKELGMKSLFTTIMNTL